MEKIRLSDGYHFIQDPEEFRHLVWKHMGNDARDYMDEHFGIVDAALVQDERAVESEKIEEISKEFNDDLNQIQEKIMKVYNAEIGKTHPDPNLMKVILAAEKAVTDVKKKWHFY